MAIGAPLIASLKAIGTVMNDAYDPWWIIASAAVALHGADAGHISDVDVLLSVDDAMRILPALGVKPQKKEGIQSFDPAYSRRGTMHRFRSSLWQASVIDQVTTGCRFNR